jgi:hypothetical protein
VSRASAANAALTVRVGGPGRVIPARFLGLSLEQASLLSYTGANANAINPALVALIRNLGPAPVLRLGGDSTDWGWYRTAGTATPPWARFTLSRGWLEVARALAAQTSSKLILGVNLEADSTRIASTEARAMLSVIGPGPIAALELGNEPELYASFNWYRTRSGVGVKGRPPGWDSARYSADFRRIAASLPGTVPVAGPAAGGPEILDSLGSFLAANRRVKLATVHAYPLKHCPHGHYVSPAQVVAESSTLGLARLIGGYARTAARHGVALRLDETNAISCGGEPGVSDSFATSLWSLDTLFAMASEGVDGVNVQDSTGSGRLFALAGDSARVYPIYYGLAMFAQAAPAGSRLLSLSGSAVRGAVRAWATRGADGATRVVLINTLARAQTVAILARGSSATVETLTAHGLGATGGVRLGGRSFNSAGRLAGSSQSQRLSAAAGAFRVRVPAASAALVSIAAS